MRISIVLIIFLGGCASTSVTRTASQDNNDVLILSLLVQDYFRDTNGRNPDLAELLQKDSLNRISSSFETVELKYKGYISVRFTFSESRDAKGIVLSDKEKELTSRFRWAEKDLEKEYDGEIRLDYGERFYRVIRIITSSRLTSKESTAFK